MKTIFNYIAWIVLISLFFLLAYNFYQQFYPYKTLVINSATTKTESIKAGELFVYTVDYCKYTDKPAIVYRTFHSVDEKHIIPFPSVATITVTGCNIADIPLQTFPTIPPGEYYLLVDAKFQINERREVDVVFRTNTFQITNN